MTQSQHDLDLVNHLTKLWDEGAQVRDKYSQKWKRAIDLTPGVDYGPESAPLIR